jgi:UDP-N-acetylmuramate dehydrogenase
LSTTQPPFSPYQAPLDFSGIILKNENLNRFTSLRLGGPADYLLVPPDLDNLQLLLQQAHPQNIPTYLLGGGTNLLVADTGVRGWVIKIDRLSGTIQRVENRIIVGAGISLSRLIKKTISYGLSGLERLYGIPGTVGGAVAQNAGAFGAAVSDSLVSITLMDETGSVREYPKEELDFSYRSGPLGESRQIIVEAVFQLKLDDPKLLEKSIKTIILERKKKFPLSKPTAGCIFKNPSQDPAGKLIDRAGMKGFAVGGVMVSPKHANFIVNTGSAKANDVYQLMSLIREKVKDRFGVLLEPEVKLWGFKD